MRDTNKITVQESSNTTFSDLGIETLQAIQCIFVYKGEQYSIPMEIDLDDKEKSIREFSKTYLGIQMTVLKESGNEIKIK